MPARDWAQLRKVLRNGDSFNREVYEWFRDADSNDTRKALRDDLLIGAKDSIPIAQIKIRAFREIIQKTHLKPTIIGQPKSSYDADVKYHPQIVLYFLQDKQSVPKGKTAKDARISFRLMHETSETLTEAELKNWANKIRTEFTQPSLYRWHKGKIIGLYLDKPNGFDFQVYAYSDEIAKTVIRKVIELTTKTYVNDKFRFTTPERNTDPTPPQVRVLGELVPEPQWRPNVFVTFDHAYANVWNDKSKRVLVDASGLQVNPIFHV
ncbi:hypothetical protein [uncultured Nostoc sp.]|uniref:hypothetical protein n=1 Tax=uncultured Nostoc sp. TaxID=340711 RepID=UPI0035C9979D